MENHLLKYLAFVRTVDTGSFTRAADSLNYAQSSVSKMIGDLEREWGVALLERGRGGVCLTSVGDGILPLAQPYYRQIGLAMKDRRRLSPAAQSFVSYLKPDAE